MTGTLLLGGGPAPGTASPAAGEVYAFASAGLTGTAVAQVKASANGSFELSLPVGTYYLAATSPRFSLDPRPATPPCHAAKAAVVSHGSTLQVNVFCELK